MEYLEIPPDDPSRGQILALVKNTKLKNKKGTGNGKCVKERYECDAEGHIAVDCIQRVARVAAGGPERLDDPMGQVRGKAKGKNGKKGKGD